MAATRTMIFIPAAPLQLARRGTAGRCGEFMLISADGWETGAQNTISRLKFIRFNSFELFYMITGGTEVLAKDFWLIL